MFDLLRDVTDTVLGRGHATITVPSMDGALKPNQALENAETVLTCADPNDLATDGHTLFLADGPRLAHLDNGVSKVIRAFDRPITALACIPGGGIGVALGGRDIQIYQDPSAEEPFATFRGADMRSVNALSSAADGAIYATDGSQERDSGDWATDLMERGRTGRLLRLDWATKSVEILAGGLEYAFGVCATQAGPLVSESWRHRVGLVAPDGGRKTVLSHLPVYPSRLAPASGGGWWLTAFTARTQLVEFVLREPRYRTRMMAEIDPQYWIVPRLSSGNSFKEPMQGAHLKTMGVIKPWAPPRSYGLVIRLDQNGHAVFSLHSRVDGVNHGIVAAVEADGWLYMIAKGPRRVLRASLADLVKDYVA